METSGTAWSGIGIAPDLRHHEPANRCVVCGRGYDRPVTGSVAPRPGTCSAVCSRTIAEQVISAQHRSWPRVTSVRADELHGHGGW